MKPFRSLLRVLAWLLPAMIGAAICDAQTAPTRIMPLGDSLTSGNSVVGAYRNHLYSLLDTAGYEVDFVGTQSDASNPSLPDTDHQGMGGYRIDQLQAELNSYLKAIEDPDVILLMIGTNDFWGGYNVSSASGRLASLISDIASKRPFAKLIVASLPPRTDSATLEAQQVAFNAQIPAIVADQVALGRQVSFADIHAALDATDLEEGVHPTQAGYDKIAEAWFTAINQVTTPLGTSNAPAVAKIEAAPDATRVAITFSKPVADDAAGSANYQIDGGVAVAQADLDTGTKRTVTLTTSPLAPGTLYTVSIQSVRDRTPQQNAITPGAAATFASQTLENGGFESGEEGWTMSGNYLVYANSDPYIASEGSTMLVLNGGQTSPNAVVSQTFATIPGQSYSFQYDVGVVAFNSNTQRLGVELSGATPLFANTEILTGNGLANSVWTTKSRTFVADSDTTTLVFRDLSTTGNGIDLLLDRVRITALPANLLANGSFEDDGNGWSMEGNFLVYPSTGPYLATDGTNMLVFNGGQTVPSGVVSQTFATTPGNRYVLEFDVGILASNTLEQRLGVEITGTNPLVSNTESLFGNAKGNSVWTNRRYTFTADSDTSTLTFRDLSATTSNLDLLVDHVRVTTPAILDDVNTAPVAMEDSYSTNQDVALVVAAPGVLANDSDSQNDPLSAALDAGPAHGALVLNPDGGFTYTPDNGYSGPDSFSYRANDGSLNSNTATVSLTVNAVNTAPVAAADSYATTRNNVLTIPPGGVLANDSDAQFDPLTAVLDAGPGHGSLTLDPNGGFTYIPDAGYTGTDSFTYHASDGALDSNTATVSLTIISLNGQLVSNGSFESGFTGWTTSGNLTIESFLPYTTTDGTKVAAFSSHNLAPNGRISQTISTVPGETYTLTFDEGVLSYVRRNQTVSVTVVGTQTLLSRLPSVSGTGTGTVRWVGRSYTFVADSASAVLTFTDQSSSTEGIDLLLDNIRITGPATDPNNVPVAFADSYSVNVNTVLMVPASGILENDFTPQGGALTAVVETQPASGALFLSPDGGFQYYPAGGFVGTDSFTYRALNGSQSSSPATVTITVNPIQPGMLSNPSFESDFTGWTPAGNLSIEYYSPTDGIKVADFNGGNKTPNGTLTQSFATTPGATYQLTYDAGILAYTNDSQTLRAEVGGNTPLLSENTTLIGQGDGVIRWTTKTHSFVAESNTTTLTFRDLSTATVGIDLLLDNVRLRLEEPVAAAALAMGNPSSTPSITIGQDDVTIGMHPPEPGRYVLERSADLVNWQLVEEIQSDGFEPLEFHDERNSGEAEPRMFYRIGWEKN